MVLKFAFFDYVVVEQHERHFVFHDSKLNAFGFWSVAQPKQAIIINKYICLFSR